MEKEILLAKFKSCSDYFSSEMINDCKALLDIETSIYKNMNDSFEAIMCLFVIILERRTKMEKSITIQFNKEKQNKYIRLKKLCNKVTNNMNFITKRYNNEK